jgi:hypothetical protein
MREGEDRLGTRSNIYCEPGLAGRPEGSPFSQQNSWSPKIGPSEEVRDGRGGEGSSKDVEKVSDSAVEAQTLEILGG